MGWVAPEWRAPKYTIVNTETSAISARLAATSVGANIDLIEGHRPVLRMASPLPASRRSPGHLSEVAPRAWISRTDVPFLIPPLWGREGWVGANRPTESFCCRMPLNLSSLPLLGRAGWGLPEGIEVKTHRKFASARKFSWWG